MKRAKEDYPSFNLFSIVGTWESVNLNPTIILYRSDKEYLLSIIYVSETTKQASPATYEIQQDGSQYFIATASKRLYVDYDSAKDVLAFHRWVTIWVTICVTSQLSSHLEINISIKQSFNHGTNK